VGLVEVVGFREVRKEGEMVERVLVWVWRTERRRMVERSDIWMLVLLKELGGSTDFGYGYLGSRGNSSKCIGIRARQLLSGSKVDNKTRIYVWTRAERGQ
jgi:hypothetical protein